MAHDATSPWQISERDFPQDGSLEERLRYLVGYAVLAPSSHNSQPWRFLARHGSIYLYADRSRRLPVVDPEDRELVISCGAALFNLRIAARHFGMGERVRLLPNPEDDDLLAVMEPVADRERTHRDEAMFSAITLRRSNRLPFEKRPLGPELLPCLQGDALAEGARLTVIAPQDRTTVVEMVAAADRVQMANPAFRRELAAWLRSNGGSQHDGMPGYAHGMGTLQSYLAPLVVRAVDLGKSQARRDQQALERSAAMAVVSTEGEGPVDWLRAGQAVEAVALAARAQGVWMSFMNPPLELPASRVGLRESLRIEGSPQLLLRLGYAPDAPATPRRPAAHALAEG